MYGVERSVVMFSRLAVLVGSVEGKTKLALIGSVGVNGAVALRERSVVLVMLVGLSQAVCVDVSVGHYNLCRVCVPCSYRSET